MIKVQYISIDKLTVNSNNPRYINDGAFKILCESIKNNPEYFESRPILCNKEMIIFAGNMRYRASKHIGLKEVPVCIMDISEKKQSELLIRDNVSSGKWDVGLLSAMHSDSDLEKYGVDLSQFGVDTEEAPEDLTSSTKKDSKPTIKISFESTDDLEKAKAIIEEVISIYKGATLSVSAGEL